MIEIICSENTEEDTVFHNRTKLGIHEMSQKSPIGFGGQIKLRCIEMCSRQILCPLIGKSGKLVILIKLNAKQL